MISALAGLVAGLIHVVSGPDHLAAIAPLAAKNPQRAWMSGMRWGLGHASGVIVIGLVSLLVRDLLPLDLISSWSERLVGLFLIGIGLWALRNALRVHAHEHKHDGHQHVHLHVHRVGESHHAPHSHAHTHAAFAIGALHGLAGSAHFFGVLPALAFSSQSQALTYFAAFGVGSVIAMGLFSLVVGTMASRLSHRGINCYRGLLCLCSVSALLIGGYWLMGNPG